MSEEKLVSKAILNCDIDSLRHAVEGKPNEVFSTLLFDSYDDKRIEELLILEAMNIVADFIDEHMPQLTFYDCTWRTMMPERVLDTNSKSEYDKKVSEFRKSINENSEKKEPIEYPEYVEKLISPIYEYMTRSKMFINNKFRICECHNVCNGHNQLYRYLVCKHIVIAYCAKYESSQCNLYIYRFLTNENVVFITTAFNEKQSQNYGNRTTEYTFAFERNFIWGADSKLSSISKLGNASKSFLLKRMCERHALNESMVSQMKKSFEIERFYHRISELASEDARLTREVNAKKEQLNSIIEDIGEKKRQLNSLDLKLISVHNELDAAITHFKQLSIINELEHERSFEQLSLEEKHLLECKHMHEFYVQNARELEIYKFAFDNMRELSQKLEQEREEFEKERTACKQECESSIKQRESEFNSSMRKREQELESKQSQFDKDCEAYELESTKWKSQQESKFAKYQKQINEYDSLKAKVSTQQNEIQRLKNELSKVTKERDRLKITIETITEYRK